MEADTISNTKPVSRIIHSRAAPQQVPELLQALFRAELVMPSSCLWIVSPWIWDIPILDNRTNSFRHVEPSWPRARIRLIKALTKLLGEGTTVHVATRPVEINDVFVGQLREATSWTGCPLHVHRKREKELHQKGVLGDHFYLRGSMNLTHNGITLNDEQVEFTNRSDVVADARIEFRNRWGGAQ